MNVEVGEEDDERDGVTNQCPVHPLGEVAVNVEGVDTMDDRKTELQLYEGGRVVVEGRQMKCGNYVWN